MSIGDLVVDSVGRCGLVVCESEEFRVLEDCSSTHRCGEG